MLSRLPLKTFGAMPKFFRFVFGIRRQLAQTEGLIGYSLDAHPLAKEFWTLSVWEDRESLWHFVQRMPHSQAMQDLLPHMKQTEFFHFEVKGSSVPPDWQETKRRMRERGTEAPSRETGEGFMAAQAQVSLLFEPHGHRLVAQWAHRRPTAYTSTSLLAQPRQTPHVLPLTPL